MKPPEQLIFDEGIVAVVVSGAQNDAVELLESALMPGRSYLVVTLPRLRGAVEAALSLTSTQTNAIYELDPEAYRPVVNVMVQPGSTPFQHVVRVRERVVAAAGVNWRTDRFADMYVYTDPEVQGRGWGRAVGAACVKELLSATVLPLYTVSEVHAASQGLAASLGFTDSGARELECQGHLRPAAE